MFFATCEEGDIYFVCFAIRERRRQIGSIYLNICIERSIKGEANYLQLYIRGQVRWRWWVEVQVLGMRLVSLGVGEGKVPRGGRLQRGIGVVCIRGGK